MSNTLKEEGLNLFRRGMHDEALAKFEAASASYAEAGDALGQGEMLNNIGVVQRVRRDWPAAEAAFHEAIGKFEKAGDENRRAQVLGNLGDLHAFKGEREEAAIFYSDAAELMAATGDHQKQAQLLRALSLLRLRQGRVVDALFLMEESLSTQPNLNPFQRLFRSLLRLVLKLAGGQ